jgi:hypothetical protein
MVVAVVDNIAAYFHFARLVLYPTSTKVGEISCR